MSRTTYSTTYYCRNSKTNKAGLAPMELCICINQKRVFINLPVKFSPKDFNKKRKPTEIEQIITQYKIRVNEIIADMKQQHQPITVTSLKSLLQKKKKCTESVLFLRSSSRQIQSFSTEVS